MIHRGDDLIVIVFTDAELIRLDSPTLSHDLLFRASHFPAFLQPSQSHAAHLLALTFGEYNKFFSFSVSELSRVSVLSTRGMRSIRFPLLSAL